MKLFIKILLIILLFFLLLWGTVSALYLKGISYIVKNPKFIEFVQNKTFEYTGMTLKIEKPMVKTHLDQNIEIGFKNLFLSKGNQEVLKLSNFDINFRIGHDIGLNKLYAKYIYADINAILDAIPKSDKKSDFTFSFFKSLILVDEIHLKYNISPEAMALVDVNNFVINDMSGDKKIIRFNFLANVFKNGKVVKVSASDNDKVYIKNNKLYVDDIFVNIDKSKVLLNLVLHNDYKYSAKVFSKSFEIEDVVNIIHSKLIDENTSDLIVYFNDIKGKVDFNLRVENNIFSGDINLKKLFFKMKYLENLPVLITQGNVKISAREIKLENFKGFYNNKSFNKLDFAGNIKDYMKSFDAKITGNAVVTNDFAKNYLSKLIDYPILIKGKADTKIIYTSKYGKMDLLWLYKFEKGSGFVIGGEDFGSFESKRILASNIHIKGPILNIENLNYYEGDISRNSKKLPVPILSFYGNVDLAHNCNLLNFGFKIPKPLTSSFINMLVKQNVFRRGTINGSMEYINTGKIPVISGNLDVEKVGVPSQRMFIRKANLRTNNTDILISSEGKYKRSDYKITGNIANRVALPVIVKNIELTVDNIDVERFMAAVNTQADAEKTNLGVDNTEQSDDVPTFDLSAILVEKCKLNLVKGFYKDIKFSNLLADLTFDKNQILTIKSNRFDFAEGISSAKIVCDLKNQLYNVKLGVRDVNSDLIAGTLLGMAKEISGKASGFINLDTDKTLRMNGKMVFDIKNGTIAKIGLFEYVLKFTSVFRNPLVAISPSTLFDFVNIPNGDFEMIKGSLEIADNVVKKISITSTSPLMSSYIAGRYNLENKDAALRIYIKYSAKNKGFYNAVRNISLNSLANRVPFGAKSSNNYYEREIEKIPPLKDVDEKDCQIYLTKVDGDIENNNFISFLKKLK